MQTRCNLCQSPGVKNCPCLSARRMLLARTFTRQWAWPDGWRQPGDLAEEPSDAQGRAAGLVVAGFARWHHWHRRFSRLARGRLRTGRLRPHVRRSADDDARIPRNGRNARPTNVQRWLAAAAPRLATAAAHAFPCTVAAIRAPTAFPATAAGPGRDGRRSAAPDSLDAESPRAAHSHASRR